MTRRRPQTSISLFPFLAVLVCAMGSLILLLLVMTRKIRHEQYGRDASAPVTVLPEVVKGDHSAEFAALETERGALDREILELKQQVREQELAVAEQQSVVSELRQKIEEINGTLKAEDVKPDESSIASLKDRVSKLRSQQVLLHRRLEEQEQRLLERQLRLKSLKETAAAAEVRLHNVNSSIIALRRQVHEAQQNATSAGTETILEFSNTAGTTRTPIIVEVTKQGYRIQPTGIDIDSKDMEGFPVSDTPLMAAILAVHRERAKGSVTSQPYVLLLVRPGGSEAFYPAQGILANEKIHFGYELIDADRVVATGESSPREVEAASSAIADAFQRRKKIYANLRYIAQGVPTQSSETPGDPSRRGLTIRSDGTVQPDSRATIPRANRQNFAGGVAPPPGFYERRAAALAAEAAAREKSRGSSGTSNTPSAGTLDQLARHHAQSDESHGSELDAGRAPQLPTASGSIPKTSPGSPADKPTALTNRVPGSDKRAEEMLFADDQQTRVPATDSAVSNRADGEPPLTAEEQFAAMQSADPDSEQQSTSSRYLQIPSADRKSGTPSLAYGSAAEAPGNPTVDLSRVDKDLLNRLPSLQKRTKTYATPVGVTVFLDGNHMTVGQQPAIPVTQDSLNAALSDLLENVDKEVADARKTPREEVMPVVKFIVSPGGERWRVPLADSLNHLGIPSASIYELSPHIEAASAPGRAVW